jgi:hypothetical protein
VKIIVGHIVILPLDARDLDVVTGIYYSHR